MGFYIDLPAMRLDDVVAHAQPKSGSLARGLGGEKGLKYFVGDPVGDAGAIIRYRYLQNAGQCAGCHSNHGLITC